MKKAILTTFICSIIVVGVALSGLVIYDRFLKNDNEPNNKEDIQNNKTYFNSNALPETSYTSKYYKETATAYGDVSKYSNIFEYFADMKLEYIKIEYPGNEIKDEEGSFTEYYTNTYNFTSSEITSFLNEMISTKQKLVGGFGGAQVPELYISYEINGKFHTTKLSAYMWMLRETTDGNIYKIIDNNMPKEDNDVLLIADDGSDVLKNIISRLNGK